MKLQVQIKPKLKERKIVETTNGSLIVSLKSPPIDGKVNQELIQLLAQKYQVPKSKIMIKSEQPKLNE